AVRNCSFGFSRSYSVTICIIFLLWSTSMIEPGQAHKFHQQLMVKDVSSAPLDGPSTSAHFPDAAALHASRYDGLASIAIGLLLPGVGAVIGRALALDGDSLKLFWFDLDILALADRVAFDDIG